MDRRQKERRRIPQVVSKRSRRSTDNKFVSAELQEIQKLDTVPPERRGTSLGRRSGQRRLVNHGPGYPGRKAEKEKEGNKYPAGELAEVKTADFIGPDRRCLLSDRRWFPGHRRATDKPDKPQEDHPGYVKGAEVVYTELWRDFNRLMGCVKAEIDFITQHFAVTDVMRGVKRKSQDPDQLKAEKGAKTFKYREDERQVELPEPEHLEQDHQARRCANCFVYDQIKGCKRGLCRRSAPPRGVGWPTVSEDDWCGEHQAHKPKV